MKNPYTNPRTPKVTVDAWIRDRRGRVLLIRRGRPPFEGRWGLPGGFCEWKETTEHCCAREAHEETGLKVRVGELRGVYSRPDRDPRGHNVTVVYAARRVRGTAEGGDDAAEARWFDPRELRRTRFAFDHREIVFEQLAIDRTARRRRGSRRNKAPRRRRSRATASRKS
jgi:8-oxo-dGTP diphosphatase